MKSSHRCTIRPTGTQLPCTVAMCT